MKKLILFFVILFYSLFVIGQNNKGERINRELLTINSLPTLEQKGDSVYWSVVNEGIQIIPDLIDNLDNNQNTGIPVSIKLSTNTYTNLFQDNRSKDFKKLKCGLFINGNGDHGYETYDRTYELQGGKKIIRYLTYVYNADTLSTLNSDIKEMKFVVDTSSFVFLNGIYFKDKNHIYVFYPMSDGGTIEINWYSDIKTFKVIKGGYGIDKRYVYYMGNIVRDADLASSNVFQSKDLNQYAYDTFNFYSGDIKLTMEEVKKLGLYNKK